ncbi:MAG TPA: DUF4393 domain-containing protein [Propionibacteriaceae bacterium]|jgi:hypothetical protein
MDPKTIASAITGAGEVAKATKEVYDDLAAPTAKAIGSTAGAIVEAFLKPARGAFRMLSDVESYLGAAIEREIARRGIPVSRLTPPDPQLYGNVIVGMYVAGDNEELREMFTRLLTTAMDAESPINTHPSLPEILRQLSPAEARFLKSMRPGIPFRMTSIVSTFIPANSVDVQVTTGVQFPPDSSPFKDERVAEASLNNMARLGIVVTEGPSAPPFGRIQPDKHGRGTVTARPNGGSLRLTALGVSLWSACGCADV